MRSTAESSESNRGYFLAALALAEGTDDDFLDDGQDEEGRPILLLAIARYDYALVDALLDAGASADNIAGDGSTVFHIIAESVGVAPAGLLRNLIARGANPNETDAVGNYPLEDAVMCGNLAAAATLVELGADGSLTGLNVEDLAQVLAEAGFEAAAGLLKSVKKKNSRKSKGSSGN